MKKILFTAMLLAALSASAQKTYNLDKPKTETQVIGKAAKTEDVATYKGQSYPVYRSERGTLFIVYLNKNGNYSKKSIPKE